MSFLDPDDRALVLSVVYDGPPEAGKTTSVRALARVFGRPLETPAQHDGRTVLFDLLEHRAGVYEGAPIRLQIVSVPGQERWAGRRAHFVSRADVVVFVGDTTRAAIETTFTHFEKLRKDLDARDGPAVGIVFQANKRDLPDAVPIAEVAARFDTERVAIFETSAMDGEGVREALVFAVKLALDRVRAEGPLEVALGDDPRLAGARELEAMLRRIEPSALDDARPSSLPPRGSWPPPGRTSDRADDVNDGLVWPPVEGRILLSEATRTGVDLRVPRDGDRVLGLGADWRLHSSADAAFATMDEGREVLVTWARLHSRARDVLSPRRCIVLFETSDGAFRVWQMVHREPSLRDTSEEGALGLVASLRHVLAARDACRRAGVELSCTLDTIGVRHDGRPHYVGPVPFAGKVESPDAALEELANDLAVLVAATGDHVDPELAVALGGLLDVVRTSLEAEHVRALFETRLAVATP